MGNYKWRDGNDSKDLPFVVVFFISRNKDNSTIPNYKERKKVFFRTKDIEYIEKEFMKFVADGLPGELSRLYISVNARDTDKVKKALIHYLIDQDSINFDHLNAIVAGLAAKKENAAEKKWLFDFDDDSDDYKEFIKDIEKYSGDQEIQNYKTVHGHHIVVEHGFDTQELMNKWRDKVTLMRDDLLLYDWCRKHTEE